MVCLRPCRFIVDATACRINHPRTSGTPYGCTSVAVAISTPPSLVDNPASLALRSSAEDGLPSPSETSDANRLLKSSSAPSPGTRPPDNAFNRPCRELALVVLVPCVVFPRRRASRSARPSSRIFFSPHLASSCTYVLVGLLGCMLVSLCTEAAPLLSLYPRRRFSAYSARVLRLLRSSEHSVRHR